MFESRLNIFYIGKEVGQPISHTNLPNDLAEIACSRLQPEREMETNRTCLWSTLPCNQWVQSNN